MNILIVLDSPSSFLWRMSDMFARSFALPCTTKILSAADLDPETWRWADWVLVGVSYAIPLTGVSLLQAMNRVCAPMPESKPFALFQVQARTDTPLSSAYGFALARSLRARGLPLVAKPTVFFCDEQALSEPEGENMRALQWVHSIARTQLEFKNKQA